MYQGRGQRIPNYYMQDSGVEWTPVMTDIDKWVSNVIQLA